MIKQWFKEKWKDILFVVVAMIITICCILVYKYCNDNDKSNIEHSDKIVYKSELNNIFGDDWYEATFNIGKWSLTGSSLDDYSLTSLFTDDLSSNPDDIGEYYINLLNPVNSWNSNINLFNVNDLPYFQINFDGTREPIYQNLNLLINNVSFWNGSLFIDYGIRNPNNNTFYIINTQSLNNRYLIMNNESYYNYHVSFLRFRSGTSISSDSTENGFTQRFGTSYTYSPFININDGIAPESYQYLQTQYNDLKTQFDALNGSYNNLSNNYNTLEQNYNTLLEQYNVLLNQSDYSFSELFWSISAVPFGVLTSAFNVDVMGVSLSGVITGLITALLLLWLIKRLFK